MKKEGEFALKNKQERKAPPPFFLLIGFMVNMCLRTYGSTLSAWAKKMILATCCHKQS